MPCGCGQLLKEGSSILRGQRRIARSKDRIFGSFTRRSCAAQIVRELRKVIDPELASEILTDGNG